MSWPHNLTAALLTISIIHHPSIAIAGDPAYYVRHYDTQSGLPQNSIKSVAMGMDGFMWIVTESGLVRFDGQHFLPVPPPNTKGDQLVRFTGVYCNGSGQILAGNGRGVFLINGLLPPTPINPIPEDQQQLLLRTIVPAWRVYDQSRINADKGAFPDWAVPSALKIEWSAKTVAAILNDSVYFINDQNKIILADTALTRARMLRITGLPGVDAYSARQHGLLTDNGNLYLRWGDFIYHCTMHGGTMQTTPVLNVEGIKSVNLIHFSPDNRMIIVGSQTSGLYLFTPRQFSMLRYADPDVNNFYALAPFGDGVFTPKGILTDTRQSLFQGYSPFVVLRTSKNEYWLNHWLSQRQSGLEQFDHTGKKIRHIKADTLRVSSMIETTEGELWLGVKDKFLARIEGDSIRYLSVAPSFQNFPVTDIEQTGPDEFWIGGNRGLAHVNVRTGKVDTVPGTGRLPIRSLHQGLGGALWLTTYGKGCFLYRKGRLIAMPPDVHGYLTHSHDILFDAHGHCWISTNKGLLQAKAEDMLAFAEGKADNVSYCFYDRRDGFQTNEFNGGGNSVAARLDDGRLVFATMDGVVRFHPDDVQPHFSSFPIRIEAYQHDTLLPATGSLQLKSPGDHLSFSISSPYWGNPLNNYLEYRLAGAEENWQTVAPDGIIRYTFLKKGAYRLEARKTSGFGGQRMYATFAFTIAPAWFETWYFRLALLLLALALGWLILRLRTRLILRQKKQLEAEVSTRTLQQRQLILRLSETVDALAGSEKRLKEKTLLQEKLSMIIVHDVQSPLRFLSDITGKIKQHPGKYAPEMMSGMLDDLHKSASSTYAFVRDFGLWLSSLEAGFVITRQPVLLKDLTDELATFFHEQVNARHNELIIDADPQLILNIHRRMLLTILRNLIDNANKNTEGGRISLTASEVNGAVTIAVSDTGRGFSEVMLTNVRKLLSTRSLTHNGKTSAIYGFRYITDFCHALGIVVSIDSTPGKGSHIILSGLEVADKASLDASLKND